MQAPSMFSEKRNMIIELVVLVAFLGALYYGYTVLSTQSPTVTSSGNQALLGPNLTLLTKAVNEDHLSFSDFSFMNTELVRQLQDFSEVIGPNASRGRDDPFVPR